MTKLQISSDAENEVERAARKDLAIQQIFAGALLVGFASGIVALAIRPGAPVVDMLGAFGLFAAVSCCTALAALFLVLGGVNYAKTVDD